MLTRRQKELLDILRERAAADPDTSPTWEEMREALGAKSKSTVSRLIKALVTRGYIRHDFKRIRSIEIIDRDALMRVTDEELIAEVKRRKLKLR